MPPRLFSFFFFNDTATTEIYTLSLHDALPISHPQLHTDDERSATPRSQHRHEQSDALSLRAPRSEEHTSELQSQSNLVCRLLLEKKKINRVRTDQRHLHRRTIQQQIPAQ